MAASLGRCLRWAMQKQCINPARFMYRNSKRKFNSNSTRVTPVLKVFSTGSVGGGMTYALFGFGKKKEEEVDILTKTYRMARLAHHQQDFEKAGQLYHKTLELAADQLKKEEITKERALTVRTMMYDGLADIALRSGHIENAKALLIETMKGCLQEGMEKTHNAIIEMSLKLSSIFAMMGQKEEAEEGFLFCIHAQSAKMAEREKAWQKTTDANVVDYEPDKLEELEQDTAVLLGMALGSYGRFLLHEKRFKDAAPYLERSRLYACHTLGTKSNQYIVVLNDLATLNIVSRQYDKAENVLSTGIKIAEKAKLEEIAMLYCNLGAVHLRVGKNNEAKKACMTAAELAKKFDHKMAFSMANNCIKKCESLKTADSSKTKT